MIIWRASPDLLDPAFAVDVRQLLERSPHTWYVLSGYRSLEEQERLYQAHLAGGPLAAPPGSSAHNYGLAVDVVPDIDPDATGLQPSWETWRPAWIWLAAVVDAHPRLHHGRHFTRVRNGQRRPAPDWPHLEAVNWKRLAQERT